MCLICQTKHSCPVSHIHNCPEVRADSIIGGVVHQNGYCIGMLLNSLCHLLPFHSQRNAQSVIHLRIHINRNRATQYQCIDYAPVDISGKNDFISPLAGSQYHTLHRTGGSAHHQKSMGCSKSLCRQFLRFPDY